MIPKNLRSRMEVACPPTKTHPRHRADVPVDSNPTAPQHYRIEDYTGKVRAKIVGYRPAVAVAERMDRAWPKSGPHVALLGTHRA